MQNADIADIGWHIILVKCCHSCCQMFRTRSPPSWRGRCLSPSFRPFEPARSKSSHKFTDMFTDRKNFTQFHMFKIPFPSTSFYVPAEPRTKPSMHHQHLHAERTQFPEMQNRYLTPIRILIHIFELVQTQKPTETWLATESHLCSHEEANNVANVGDEEHEELQIGCTQWIDLNQDAKRYRSRLQARCRTRQHDSHTKLHKAIHSLQANLTQGSQQDLYVRLSDWAAAEPAEDETSSCCKMHWCRMATGVQQGFNGRWMQIGAQDFVYWWIQ